MIDDQESRIKIRARELGFNDKPNEFLSGEGAIFYPFISTNQGPSQGPQLPIAHPRAQHVVIGAIAATALCVALHYCWSPFPAGYGDTSPPPRSPLAIYRIVRRRQQMEDHHLPTEGRLLQSKFDQQQQARPALMRSGAGPSSGAYRVVPGSEYVSFREGGGLMWGYGRSLLMPRF